MSIDGLGEKNNFSGALRNKVILQSRFLKNFILDIINHQATSIDDFFTSLIESFNGKSVDLKVYYGKASKGENLVINYFDRGDRRLELESDQIIIDSMKTPLELIIDKDGKKACITLVNTEGFKYVLFFDLSKAKEDTLLGLRHNSKLLGSTALNKIKLIISDYTDKLTGLYSRGILSQIEESYDYFVLFLDLNRFKQINDSHGHNVGDEVLKLLGIAIKKGVRAEDYGIRWSGDEFVILLKKVDENGKVLLDVSGVQDIISRITKNIGDLKRDNRILENVEILFTSGYSSTSPDVSLDGALGAAETAMRLFKDKGGENYRVISGVDDSGYVDFFDQITEDFLERLKSGRLEKREVAEIEKSLKSIIKTILLSNI